MASHVPPRGVLKPEHQSRWAAEPQGSGLGWQWCVGHASCISQVARAAQPLRYSPQRCQGHLLMCCTAQEAYGFLTYFCVVLTWNCKNADPLHNSPWGGGPAISALDSSVHGNIKAPGHCKDLLQWHVHERSWGCYCPDSRQRRYTASHTESARGMRGW